mmetsp:Transcript_1273/g.3471  ORF Transcript_1273/g.3471 Transcript_1273/m.3471 type:complete len:244 (+) Transcript_1273:514-1245(+)
MCRDDLCPRHRAKRSLFHDDEIHQTTEGEHVSTGTWRNSGFLAQFRSHPSQTAAQRLRSFRQQPRQTQIEKFHDKIFNAAGHHDVGRFEVPVHHDRIAFMHVPECARDAEEDDEASLVREIRFLHGHVQRFPVEVLQDQCDLARIGIDASTVKEDDVRMAHVPVHTQLINQLRELCDVAQSSSVNGHLHRHRRAVQTPHDHLAETPRTKDLLRPETHILGVEQPMFLYPQPCESRQLLSHKCS